MFFFAFRCLLGYFLEVSEEDLPWQEVPLHSVIKLSPKAYGCQSEVIRFDVASVSTHRPKPDVPGQLEKRLECLLLLSWLIISYIWCIIIYVIAI